MWEIHTFGNGDVIASVLAGIRSALAIGNFMIDRRQYFPLFFGAVVVFYISTQIPVDVLVVDEVNSDVADQVVAGVPLAVALPAYASGYAGWRFTQLVETAFAIPANYSTGRSTLNRPMFDLQKIVGAEIRDGDLEERIGSYLMDCVFADMELTPPLAGSPTITVLRTSGDLLTDIATANLARAVGMTG
ncbi:MAG: conjugal transfer protein TraG N-terminal domain-containing protein, partial [Nitrospirae bacterium]|nr:conjugal transfer protein TraG N-terminal domain-containing protein [Nitrospirota bacterium]